MNELIVLSRSSKSAVSRHDNVRASSTLFIWLDENVVISLLTMHLWLSISNFVWL